MGRRPPGVEVQYPRYGTVRSVLLFVMFYLLVAHATTALVETLRAVAPGVSSTPLNLVMAASLWLVLGLLVLHEVRRQTRDNPEMFVARQVLVKFLDQHRPSLREHVGWFVGALAGAAVVYRGWSRFFPTLDDALLVGKRLAEQGSPGQFSTTNVAWGVGFVLGFVLLAVAVDRFLIGLSRELLYQYYRESGGGAGGRESDTGDGDRQPDAGDGASVAPTPEDSTRG